GSDPTFIYAAILAGDYDSNPNQPRHRQRQSPYNTYLVSGLPPGPIASPGRASLEAVLNPDQTEDLYFVVNSRDGRHKFSRTAAAQDFDLNRLADLFILQGVLQVVCAGDLLAVDGDDDIAHALNDRAAPHILIEHGAAQPGRGRTAATRHGGDHQAFARRQAEGAGDARAQGERADAEVRARHIAFANQL